METIKAEFFEEDDEQYGNALFCWVWGTMVDRETLGFFRGSLEIVIDQQYDDGSEHGMYICSASVDVFELLAQYILGNVEHGIHSWDLPSGEQITCKRVQAAIATRLREYADKIESMCALHDREYFALNLEGVDLACTE